MTFKMRGPMFFGSALKKYGKKSEPVAKMKGDLNKDGDMSDYEKNRQDAIDENMEKEGSGMNYGKKAKTPHMHKIPEPFEGNYGQAHHNMDFDKDTSEGKKGHYKRLKH